MRITFLLFLVMLACAFLAPRASADWHLGLDGVYHTAPHHWYTNDSSREGRALNDIESGFPSDDGHHDEGAIHVRAPHDDDHGDWDDLPSPHAPHKLRERCKGYRLLYLMRHGLTTPSSLHGEHGCHKWMDDAIYHDEKREPMFPTLRGMLDEELSHV